MTTSTTTTTQKHSQNTRPDLQRSRMVNRRRLHASISTTPTVQESVARQQHVMTTYSDFLRNFDTIPVSFNEDYRHRPSFAISPFGELVDEVEAGPSHLTSGFYPQDQKQDFLVESSWAGDGFGHHQVVGHGKIEVIQVGGSFAGQTYSDDELDDNFATPRAKTRTTIFGSSSIVGGPQGGIDSERASRRSRKDSLPLTSTPPNGERLKNLPSLKSLKETITTADYHSLKHSTATPPMPVATTSVHQVFTPETEVALVGEIIEAISSSKEDIEFMSTVHHSNLFSYGFLTRPSLVSPCEEPRA